ncbi:MAG: hypothetical protein GKR95_19285 [Gammaproteobacteria bacterium]|nr:hypothetical protein [Gammaproteobacteria bacterium]
MIFVSGLGIYFLIGFVFSIAFFFKGYEVINAEAANSSMAVRILWCPAAIAIWPLLLYKWCKK